MHTRAMLPALSSPSTALTLFDLKSAGWAPESSWVMGYLQRRPLHRGRGLDDITSESTRTLTGTQKALDRREVLLLRFLLSLGRTRGSAGGHKRQKDQSDVGGVRRTLGRRWHNEGACQENHGEKEHSKGLKKEFVQRP